MTETTKKTALYNTYRILSGRFSFTVAGSSSVIEDDVIDHPISKPILFKVFFTLDGRPELYHTPILNTAIAANIFTAAYVTTDSLSFIATNGDTSSHTFNVTYLIYADKFK